MTAEELFDTLGAFECTDHRFASFIEGMSSYDVRPSVEDQRHFAERVNERLTACAVVLQEVGEDEGYPVFQLVELGASTGRPKNLIFASPSKPDLRFRDAVNNDIEIVTNAGRVLVYDWPISADGVRWLDLQTWWATTNDILDPDTAKRSLYRRLRESLPDNSPPQRFFFEAYHRAFGDRIPELPALLPEVWLYWDPRTARERGAAALARFRMDFLLLLPANRRIVIEVDGKHHYSEGDLASPRRYARMVAADRDLRLAGYDVYRFGADELRSRSDQPIVGAFFEQLFRKHGLQV